MVVCGGLPIGEVAERLSGELKFTAASGGHLLVPRALRGHPNGAPSATRRAREVPDQGRQGQHPGIPIRRCSPTSNTTPGSTTPTPASPSTSPASTTPPIPTTPTTRTTRHWSERIVMTAEYPRAEYPAQTRAWALDQYEKSRHNYASRAECVAALALSIGAHVREHRGPVDQGQSTGPRVAPRQRTK